MNEILTEAEREEIRRRVHGGALMFDQRGPRSWAQTLNENREILEVGSINHCPLGIVFGWYGSGLGALGLISAEASLLGFTIVVGDGLDDGSHGRAWENAVWDAMSAAWRCEAAQRVAAAR